MLETWDRHQCVRLDLAHHMICDTIWLGQIIHHSIRLRRGEHDGAIIFALTLKTTELLAKAKISENFGIFGPWGPKF